MSESTRPTGLGWGVGRQARPASEPRPGVRGRRFLIAAFIAAVATGVYAVARPSADTATASYEFTGRTQLYVVPAGICRVEIRAVGASGGAAGTAGSPGIGARASASFAVVPDETLYVNVGGAGGAASGLVPGDGGWNGGGAGGLAFDRYDGRAGKAGSGGGGATDIRRGGTGLERRILVAGGGSGGAGSGIGGPPGTGGGDGGDLNGADGLAPLGSINPASGGKGGSSAAGGAAGRSALHAGTATDGRRGVGGDGAPGGVSGGGGGGGGLYGGGGGGSVHEWGGGVFGGGHGGGGSSYGPPDTAFRSGAWGNPGSGRAELEYDRDADACGH